MKIRVCHVLRKTMPFDRDELGVDAVGFERGAEALVALEEYGGMLRGGRRFVWMMVDFERLGQVGLDVD